MTHKRKWLTSPALFTANYGGELWQCLLGDDSRHNRMARIGCYYHWLGREAEVVGG